VFGYVQVRKPELKIKDYDTYRGFYCGLCSVLKKKYGFTGQLTLTYDMTFLIILLSSVYDLPSNSYNGRCIIHPAKKHLHIVNDATDYAAHMNIILSYYHFEDDYNDEASKKAWLGRKVYRKKMKKAADIYSSQEECIVRELNELGRLEKEENSDINMLADCFGRLMTGLFMYKNDIFSDYFTKLAFHLGRFIYIMDAYDDLEEDIKKGSYNPLKELRDSEDYHDHIEKMLLGDMAEAASAFRKLPCVKYEDILGNIIYAGVWNRFDTIKMERAGSPIKEDNKNE